MLLASMPSLSRNSRFNTYPTIQYSIGTERVRCYSNTRLGRNAIPPDSWFMHYRIYRHRDSRGFDFDPCNTTWILFKVLLTWTRGHAEVNRGLTVINDTWRHVPPFAIAVLLLWPDVKKFVHEWVNLLHYVNKSFQVSLHYRIQSCNSLREHILKLYHLTNSILLSLNIKQYFKWLVMLFLLHLLCFCCRFISHIFSYII